MKLIINISFFKKLYTLVIDQNNFLINATRKFSTKMSKSFFNFGILCLL